MIGLLISTFIQTICIVLRFEFVENDSNTGPFYIKEGRSLVSYLNQEFNDVKEDIFPYDVNINMSLSNIAGTLYYSIDKNNNQLIINLESVLEPLIDIEFRRQHFRKGLLDLCGCTLCKYEILVLRIQIKDKFYLQCNNVNRFEFKYNDSRLVNKKYPVPNMNDQTTSNKAKMWLVNHQIYGNVYPNPIQMTGCIFNALYRDNVVEFSDISTSIGRTCERTCTAGICNSGICYETYYHNPICNCTGSFKNGDFCNNSLSSKNQRSEDEQFQFQAFKISWKSMEQNLLLLENKKLYILLSSDNISLTLDFQIKAQMDIILKVILTKAYRRGEEYILIAYFYDTYIDIQFLDDSKWLNSKLHTNINLKTEVFSSIKMRSGLGHLDLVYKENLNDIKWKNVNMLKPKPLENEQFIPIAKSATERKSAYYSDWRKAKIAAIVLALMVIVCIVFIIYSHRDRLKTLCDRPSSGPRPGPGPAPPSAPSAGPPPVPVDSCTSEQNNIGINSAASSSQVQTDPTGNSSGNSENCPLLPEEEKPASVNSVKDGQTAEVTV